jgi:hypothetical protein
VSRSAPLTIEQVRPGMKVKVRHRVKVGGRIWYVETVGKVLNVEPVTVGLHTDRVAGEEPCLTTLLLKEDDGELTRITWDQFSEIELLEPPEESQP